MTEDIDPETATEDWLMNEQNEVTDQTLANYSTVAKKWCQFCEEKGIDSMADVSGRTLMRFKQWRADQVKTSTVGQNLSCLRRFINHCENIEAVKLGLLDKVPDVRARDNSRDEKVDAETAESILSYLHRFDYASRRHAIFELIWHTAFRTVTIRSIDIDDCYLNIDAPYIELNNRPDEGTRLKNGLKSEREVSLTKSVADVLQDYINQNRFDVVDKNGRNPLFTTRQGRATKNTIRRDIRTASRPCEYGGGCPFDEDPASCNARSNRHKAGDCPGSTTGHPLRRGSITHTHLDNDIPKRVVSDRCDVSVEVLTKHYDRQTEERKRQIRREYLEGV
ncbi:tyrosine-type recombinase/integrase [Halorubrum ezzemoulense]|nr:tyrosine-type recombinase/integrase [Halorubrum ezzemoulense]MDB9263948.1 tyrosine-type recombinase/integrase [Halorubrum ezzemoulense]MDB9266712.1 tyrosine-type recombinase/integrase [Halorubrum ezzemoulense]MDB9286911.1 tyrosine-type recombinase/integrase [Halorubrum ezzemoulense]MDB9290886.1 tyrosine-type recombinase/integrase [Halorubrum ezzemoulense]MDB9297923.1 tyrosine-type recombinase/integrase [Halorubrum ezzemoulense]